MQSLAKSHSGGTNGMIIMSPNLFQSMTQTAVATTSVSMSLSSAASSGHSSSSAVPVVSSLLAGGDMPSSSSLPGSSSSTSAATVSAAPSASPLVGGVTAAPACQPPQLSALAQHQHQQRLHQAMMGDAGRAVNGVTTTSTAHAPQVDQFRTL